MKYICLQHRQTKEKFIVAFDRSLNHVDMAEVAARVKVYENSPPYSWNSGLLSVVSAGFIDHKGSCHGRSESLQLNSDPEDTKIWLGQYK